VLKISGTIRFWPDLKNYSPAQPYTVFRNAELDKLITLIYINRDIIGNKYKDLVGSPILQYQVDIGDAQPFQLPAPPIGRGRGAMLLQLLNQQRPQHPPAGVQIATPNFGYVAGRGRAWMNAPLHTLTPVANQGTAGINTPPLNQQTQLPAPELWDDDDIIIL
jgi:hypothetical protein